MRIIELRYLPRRLLAVNVNVSYYGKTFSKPVPFLVDTAAERTFIVPHWQRRIDREIGPIEVGPDATPADTLLGVLKFNAVKGLKLEAHLCDGKRIQLNQTFWVCVSKRTWFRRGGGRLTLNILGRDLIKDWTLYHNPHTGTKFLVGRQEYIDNWMKGDARFDAYFKRPPRPTIDSGDIDWGKIRSS